MESYAKICDIGAARRVFDKFCAPDSFMWGVMIKGYVWNQQLKEAISLYHQGMLYRRVQLSSFILTPVLQACSGLYDMAVGRKIHGRLVKDGFESDTVVETALLQMYAGGGSLEDAFKVFDEITVRDEVSWSLMISSCVQCGQSVRGLELFSRMNLENMEEDRVLMLTVAEACADVDLLREAKSVHGRVLRRWAETDEVMESSLITMYSSCRDLESAEKLLGKASKRSVIAWTAMISSYNKSSRCRDALRVCARMLESKVEPNTFTMMGVLFSCTRLRLLEEGKSIHGFSVRRIIDPHLNSLGSALITMYSSCRNLSSCFSVFDQIEIKTTVSWNSIIAACSHNGSPEKALDLFARMLSAGFLPDSYTLASALPACGDRGRITLGRQIHGIVNKIGMTVCAIVQNSLMDMYCKCRSVDAAFRVFDDTDAKDVVAWNTMIRGLSENGCSEKAISLFGQMHCRGADINMVTYLSTVKACANIGSLSNGRWIHHSLIMSGLRRDSRIDAALTNMYAKCGDLDTARQVFDSAAEKDVVLWSSIISGYGYHGLISDAISLFSQMAESGVRPNKVTFMTIISACCHAGLVEEGLLYFDMMREKYGIEPELEHYVSVVDLLSRAGQIDKACDFIGSMHVEPDACIWRALLHGCHIHQREDMVSGIQGTTL